MKTKNVKELSYFRVKLENYLKLYHPERLSDEAFIAARADESLSAYADAIEQGFDHTQAETIANEVMFIGLHFSKYNTIVKVLENEFEKELPSPLPEKLAPILLNNKYIQSIFDKHELNDEFDGSPEFDLLYTELTGGIVHLIEKNNLPTIESLN